MDTFQEEQIMTGVVEPQRCTIRSCTLAKYVLVLCGCGAHEPFLVYIYYYYYLVCSERLMFFQNTRETAFSSTLWLLYSYIHFHIFFSQTGKHVRNTKRDAWKRDRTMASDTLTASNTLCTPLIHRRFDTLEPFHVIPSLGVGVGMVCGWGRVLSRLVPQCLTHRCLCFSCVAPSWKKHVQYRNW